MMAYAGAIDDAWYEEFRGRIEGIEDLAEALPILEELVDRLHDYHTNFYWEGKPRWVTPGISLGIVEGQVCVVDSEPGLAVARGDIVTAIDGRDALARSDRSETE